jgi:Cupin-like domain
MNAQKVPEHRHLGRFPNHDAPLHLAEYTLTEAKTSFDAHLRSGTPCVIREAIPDWPARDRWSQLDYWTSVARDVRMKCLRSIERRGASSYLLLSAKDAITAVFEDPEYTVLIFPLGPCTSPYTLEGEPFDLQNDIRPFLFGPSSISAASKDFREPLVYSRFRAFVHRRSYTDWHDHPVDDSLSVQILGKKRFLLLPPTLRTWEFRNAVLPGERHLDPGYAFEGFRDIRPIAVDLGPGDLVFIPPLWLHAVESIDDDFGVTLACASGTPLHRFAKLELPYVRRSWRERLKADVFGNEVPIRWRTRWLARSLPRLTASVLFSVARGARRRGGGVSE